MTTKPSPDAIKMLKSLEEHFYQAFAANHEIDNSGKCFTTTKSYISVVVNDTWDGEIIYKNN